ncbi:MAG: hypothetical protein AAGH99_01205 [Planctomycetota bacterium]
MNQTAEPNSSPTERSKAKPSRVRRRLGYVVLLAISLIGFFVVRAAWRLQATPAYWEQHQSFITETTEQDLEKMAQGIQSRTLREWSYPIGDGDGVRTVRYHFDEINAWLATRLRPLLKNQNLELPPQIGEFILAEREGQLVLAFDYESSSVGNRIASVRFGFRGDGESPLAGRVRWFGAGEQRLPLRQVVAQFEDQPALQDEEIQTLLDKISRREFIELPPIPVDDHREATVLGLELTPTGIDLLIRIAYLADKPEPIR